MKLQTRLQLFGALVPAALLFASFGLVGAVLDHLLLAEIDRALLGQAAVESVSLFDRLAHGPHLHLNRSPMAAEAREISAISAIYGPDGGLLLQAPDHTAMPDRLQPSRIGAPPLLRTVHVPGNHRDSADQPTDEVRELVVTVGSPEGKPHALRLAVPLARHHATMRMYWRAASAIGALVTLLLLGLQIRHARTLDRRIVGLAAHMRRLRQGDFEGLPPVDTGDDVLTELREAIADATARLQAARTAQERLLADAAHELRTPLAAMRTDIDIALRRERDPAELRETLQRSRQEVDRLALLSQQLLDLAALRQMTWDRPAGDVVQVLAEALQAHRAVAEERGVRLVRTGLPMLQARFQSAPLRQVVDNLLSNALRFAPRGSTVTASVERAGDKWRLSVQDEGPGVPEAQQQAIFQPFHRPDKSSSGAGLGLAIVQDVARRHGGRAYVAAGGPGARFVVEMNFDS